LSYVNEATWDRTFRVLLGALILYLGWGEELLGLWGAAARIFGFVPLITGIIGWSPTYAIFEFSTVRRRHRPDASDNS